MSYIKHPSELTSNRALEIFNQSIHDYHEIDSVYAEERNPYPEATIEWFIYHKNWIDTIQWHLEDEIRNPLIEDKEIAFLKRWIDRSNQARNDTVEKIDDWFYYHLKDIPKKPHAKLNSESPAWILDRLSILSLKIYHMQIETQRKDASQEHREKCHQKLLILLEQQKDLSQCYDEYIQDILKGEKYMKVYRQMKMYNDEELNPVLRRLKK
ncbi:MAG: DUF4254 domain-containing protein [Leptospiraceae bacterium]|nr:DUF4254 domain-containing protein [Leptospiraceae bacterium]MDW7975562.1 DUF4254 domain-containing protein [Leptospiraceae bacterium]